MRGLFSAYARLLLNAAGVMILLAGVTGATLVWRAQDRIDNAAFDDSSLPLAPLDSRKASRQTEMYYGKTGLVMERWTEWAEGLTQGKPLAKSILVGSALVAIGFFIAGGRCTGRGSGN